MTSIAVDHLLNQVRAFVDDEVAPAAAGWSMGAEPDPALFTKAGALNLMGIEVPAYLGGLGLSFAVKTQVCEIIAATDFGIAMALVNSHNVAARLCRTAPPNVRDRYLPRLLSGKLRGCTALTEPGAGSDFASIITQASKIDGGWRLSGEKAWIINARHAQVSIVFAQCREIGDVNGISAFAVDLSAPGVQRYAIDGPFQQTSIGTGGFTLDKVEIAEDCQLVAPGKAFKTVLSEINGARAYVAAMCNAMLRAAITEASAYGVRRTTFGVPLMDHPSWQHALDAAQADLTFAEGLVARAVQDVDRGADAQLSAAEAKVECILICQRHMPSLLHAMGAEGLRPAHCFTRHLAAAQVAGFTDGATNMLRDRVARLKQTASAD
tara:strand:+ start:655 stop:1794 length:1140 start_codon:yes stop_codon:yes gene_type:complete